MKIAFISLYLPSHLRGGVPVQAHLLANALVSRGHAIDVHTLYDPPEDAQYHVVKTVLPRPLERLNGRFNAAGIHLFPFFLSRRDWSGYDVIHAHGDSHFIRPGRVPVVRTLHSAGIHLGAMALRVGAWRSFLSHASVYPFEVLAAQRADRVVFVGSGLRRFFARGGEVIPNAVDLAAFRPEAARSPHPSILFVAGSMRGTKRGALLVEAFERVRARCLTAELWMVCPERVEGHGIVSYGSLDHRTLPSLYRRAWVFCLPSSYDSFGIPYVEAMASGAVVVATPNDGAREILGASEHGLLCQPPDLAATLLRVLEDQDLREEYRRRGLARAQAFSLEQVVSRYESIYRELADARARPRACAEAPGDEAVR